MTTETRVDASVLSEEERGQLPQLAGAVEESLELVVGDKHVRLPQPLAQFFAGVMRDLSRGKSVVVIPEDEVFTTQAAAAFLGMSRQYFVADVLEKGLIPFHRVGTHRRIKYKDLMTYRTKRDAERRKTLNKVFDEVDSAGLYDASADYTGEGDASR